MREALDMAVAYAAREGAARIDALALRVGPLAGVVPEALSLAFDVVTEGTPAAGARLVIEETPIVLRCRACGARVEAPALTADRPCCATPCMDVVAGRECDLAWLEVS
jgi:hydrogenase nickel incorporation protein HypA/HybF